MPEIRLYKDKADTVEEPSFADPWSLNSHYTSGVMAGFITNVFFPRSNRIALLWLWLLIHTVYEIKDYYVAYIMQPLYTPEKRYNSAVNGVGDTFAAVLGFLTYYAFRDVGIWTKQQKQNHRF